MGFLKPHILNKALSHFIHQLRKSAIGSALTVEGCLAQPMYGFQLPFFNKPLFHQCIVNALYATMVFISQETMIHVHICEP